MNIRFLYCISFLFERPIYLKLSQVSRAEFLEMAAAKIFTRQMRFLLLDQEHQSNERLCK